MPHSNKYRGGCGSKGYKGYKGEGPQSRRLTANLFINIHEIMKEKRKYVDIRCGIKTGFIK
eukprot:164592-Pelagomonas_calceolata.AAC.1